MIPPGGEIVERKLTAILCADVHGYSRLMGEDEKATLQKLNSYRKIIDSLIEQHSGRFVNSAGDSVLAEFASVVNAVECAVEIQTALKTENANLPPARRMEFRIGINLGDVMVEGEQIYGDGVNVAARLESLADPGGICISRTVHENIRNKLPLNYEDLGEQSVKNIAEPVRVYRVLPETGGATPRKTPKVVRRYLWRGAFSLAGLAIVVATVVLVQHLSLRPPTTTASIPPAQGPALSLPDRPSIAVLPFTNMSGDREQEYFSDGLTDDLITALAGLPGLFVIARNSTFTYKGKAVKVQDVSRELGVTYVLEGSVQKAGGRVRITAQLVDAASGEHLWAEHYDRPLRETFALQDEIVRKIVTTLNLQLSLWEEHGILQPKRTDNIEAYDYLLRGWAYVWTVSREGDDKARQMFQKAIELDPKYADAYVGMGFTYWHDWFFQWNKDPQLLDQALQLGQQAISLDDSNPEAYALLSAVEGRKKQYDRAIGDAERAIALAPNFSFGYEWLATALMISGRPAEALKPLEKVMRLDPRNRDRYFLSLGGAYEYMGRYKDSVAAYKRGLDAVPNNLGTHVALAIDYIELGRDQEARAEAAEVLRINPHFLLRPPIFKDQALNERFLADARKAGLK
jgi:adenylate cyclase